MESPLARAIRLAKSPLPPSQHAIKFDPVSRRLGRVDTASPAMPEGVAEDRSIWGTLHDVTHTEARERGDGLPPHKWSPKMWGNHAMEMERAVQIMQNRRQGGGNIPLSGVRTQGQSTPEQLAMRSLAAGMEAANDFARGKHHDR